MYPFPQHVSSQKILGTNDIPNSREKAFKVWKKKSSNVLEIVSDIRQDFFQHNLWHSIDFKFELRKKLTLLFNLFWSFGFTWKVPILQLLTLIYTYVQVQTRWDQRKHWFDEFWFQKKLKINICCCSGFWKKTESFDQSVNRNNCLVDSRNLSLVLLSL